MKRPNLTAALALAGIPLGLACGAAIAAAVPGGSLDPTTIPKYTTPLVIPPVLYDDGGAPMTVQVELREITQQVLPAGYPSTPLWAYGDPNDGTSFNNPAFTIEVTKDTATTVKWINGLAGKTHIIRDSAGAPLIDQTLHWAAPNRDCLDGVPRTDCRGASAQPYLGPVPMVTHVHGAHVAPDSDGYPEAWWLPAGVDPVLYETAGTFFSDSTYRDADPTNDTPRNAGYALYEYSNDQPTTTLWYHDHSLGMTRLNVYAAGAGFWLIRDAEDKETGLVSGTLPGPAPQAGEDPNNDPAVRAAIREIPIAIQPKSFNSDGTQFYPANRAFFEGLGTGATFADNTGVSIAFLPQAASDIAPVWNPEAFFNTMVVNGRTWPVLEVAPERYRFRLLNAADSRFMNLALINLGVDGAGPTTELPIYQIGSEQGLLPQVVRIETGFATPLPGDGTDVPDLTRVPGTFADQALLIAPAERADVVVDFSGLADGTVVRMINTAPDAPFGGFPDVPADPGTTGQVMQFVVSSALANGSGDPSTPAASLQLDPNPGGVPKLGAPALTRDLALLEEESVQVCVSINAITGAITQIDLSKGMGKAKGTGKPKNFLKQCAKAGGLPFAPKAAVLGVAGAAGGQPQLWDDPIAQNPALGSTEEWELWNWSVDAHPIHLHLVKFEVVNREVIGGAVRAPEPWEAGWKDTVIAYPGEVTRVKALFDIPGLYVWHCHILSHEDNEMMVPYCVGTPGVDCPAQLF